MKYIERYNHKLPNLQGASDAHYLIYARPAELAIEKDLDEYTCEQWKMICLYVHVGGAKDEL